MKANTTTLTLSIPLSAHNAIWVHLNLIPRLYRLAVYITSLVYDLIPRLRSGLFILTRGLINPLRAINEQTVLLSSNTRVDLPAFCPFIVHHKGWTTRLLSVYRPPQGLDYPPSDRLPSTTRVGLPAFCPFTVHHKGWTARLLSVYRPPQGLDYPPSVRLPSTTRVGLPAFCPFTVHHKGWTTRPLSVYRPPQGLDYPPSVRLSSTTRVGLPAFCPFIGHHKRENITIHEKLSCKN